MRPPAHLRSAALPASLPCNTADGSHPGRLLASPSRRPAGGGPIDKSRSRPTVRCMRPRARSTGSASASGWASSWARMHTWRPLRWRPGRRRCSHANTEADSAGWSMSKHKSAEHGAHPEARSAPTATGALGSGRLPEPTEFALLLADRAEPDAELTPDRLAVGACKHPTGSCHGLCGCRADHRCANRASASPTETAPLYRRDLAAPPIHLVLAVVSRWSLASV
jgi:hypothetical protein